MSDWLRDLIESDPQYQKQKEEQIKKNEQFHKENPHMMDLLIQSDEDTSFISSDE